jgi:ribosomal protein S18 acetylase RimI-like enzyme
VDDAGLEGAGLEGAGPNGRILVRRARADELAACARIYVRVLTDTFTWIPPERHRAEDFLAAAREEEIYVAVEGPRLLGMAALYRPQRFLHSLYVTDRGRGVGKLLLDHVLEQAGGVLSLKCQAANTAAQAFYIREGFRCTEAGEDGGVAWLRFVRG